MAAKMKITLAGSVPQITRTIAIPSGTTVFETVSIIITSLEMSGGREYTLLLDWNTLSERQLSKAEQYNMDIDELRSHRVRLIYDDYPGWTMDVVFQKDTESDVPKVLKYKGDSPPRMLAGTRDWNMVNKAASDPQDPYHDQADAWLSLVEPFDEDMINERLEKNELAIPGPPYRLDISDPAESLLDMMGESRKTMDSTGPLKDVFRCPVCGSECDGRLDKDGTRVEMQGVMRYPAIAMCPSCREPFEVHLTNDGYRKGYCDETMLRPYDQCLPYYDLLRRKDEDMTPVERARFITDLALAEFRYGKREKTPIEELREECWDQDPSDPEQFGIMMRLMALMITRRPDECADVMDDAENMTECLHGTFGSILLSCIGKVNHSKETDVRRDLLRQALDLLNNDAEEGPYFRLLALKDIINGCNEIEDGGILSECVGTFEKIVEVYTSDPASKESAEWSILCHVFEMFCQTAHELKRIDLAEMVVKIMSGPFADEWCEPIPPGVRNIVRFRRAIVFLSGDGDREQAIDDLVSVDESSKSLEENGPFTNIRMLFCNIILISMGKRKPEDVEPIMRKFIEILNWQKAPIDDIVYTYILACSDAGKKKGWIANSLENMGVTIQRWGDTRGQSLTMDQMWKLKPFLNG